MKYKILSFTGLALLGMTAVSPAREQPVEPRSLPHQSTGSELVQLAQSRPVEVYRDQFGREVLVDPFTGEIIAIREPQPIIRFEPPPQERYYLNDPEDMRRFQRDRRLEQLGRGMPEERGFPILPREDFREYEEPYPEMDEDFAREEPFPEEPFIEEEPPLSERERLVEREPLDDSSIVTLPDREGPDMILEDPSAVDREDSGGLPDISDQPEISHSDVSEDVAKIQILLDRAGASPGVIDGRIGDNVNKAIDAYRTITGETLRTYDKEYINAQLEETGGEAFTTYEITDVDAAGPFVASIPSDYGEKAQLERLGYTSVAEMLAERFHLDEDYLRVLNPGVDFGRPGTIIKVPNLGQPIKAKVTSIVADKSGERIRVYGEDDELVAVYPATIGSQSTPSPEGTHTVERVALDPVYTYNPELNFKQGDNDDILTIPPGPNNPVGVVWIALSKPTYGIHGTPEPAMIGKSNSHGCIRLTNWDARELAEMVEPGVTVEFVD